MSISKPNLAQVGDYLNGMPPAPSSIQQLDKWSKGANPEIPGWAAAGALQQKTQEMSQQKNAQGATMGPMPTIIDQLRQKAAMVEQQRQQQEEALNSSIQKSVQGQTLSAHQRAQLTQQSAANLESQLTGTDSADGIKLDPLGTNLYVRNYYSPPVPEYFAKQKKLIVNQKSKAPNAKK